MSHKRRVQEQFKDSLFFPEIHARQEQISEAHRGTCRWIFYSSKVEDGSSSSCTIGHDASAGQVRREQFNESDSGSQNENGDHATDLDDGYPQAVAQGRHETLWRNGADSSDYGQGQPWSNFVDWLEHGDGVYWINGKAGSGKSTLMRFITNELLMTKALHKWINGSDLMVSSFFFWNPGTVLQ